MNGLRRAGLVLLGATLGGCSATLPVAGNASGASDEPRARVARRAPPPVPAPAALDGWSRVGDQSFRIDGNAANAGPSEAAGYLVELRQRGDVRISLEYWIDEHTNSGIFLRCQNPLAINPADCYEINIRDQHDDPRWRTGALVLRRESAAVIDGLERWVRVEAEACGTSIRATFDGVKTVEYTGAQVRRGRLALQYGGGGRLQFRNVVVTPLDGTAAACDGV